MNNPNDLNKAQDAWIQSAVDELDNSVETMDSIDTSRLRTARQMAYREAEEKRQKSWHTDFSDWLNWKGGLIPVFTITFFTAFILNSIWSPNETKTAEIARTTQPTKPKVDIKVIPLLTAQEDLEFYESVNFLLWLENKQKKS